MPGPPAWPPPPAVPNPLSEHDEFLTACVLRSSAKVPVTRLRLVQELRKERGIDFRQSRAIVNDYCDRYAILIPPRGLEAWFRILVAVILLAASCIMSGSLLFLTRNYIASATHAEKIAILTREINLVIVYVGIALAVGCFTIIFAVRNAKKARRDAEYAQKTLAG